MKFSFQFDTKKQSDSMLQLLSHKHVRSISRAEFLSQIPKYLNGIDIGPFADPLLAQNTLRRASGIHRLIKEVRFFFHRLLYLAKIQHFRKPLKSLGRSPFQAFLADVL